MAGWAAGAAAGSSIPFADNLIRGITGATGGDGIGMCLNSHLQPHMRNLALDITDMTRNNIGYLYNQEPVDRLVGTFQLRAKELTALNVAGK